MKNKITWLALSLLALVSMVVVSCGQTTTPGTTGTAVTGTAIIPTATGTTPTATTTVKTTATTIATTTTTAQGKPKYGGVFKVVHQNNLNSFGFPVFGGTQGVGGLVFEQILSADWTKGPAGTNETTYGAIPSSASFTTGGGVMREQDIIGYLAESFEQPQIGVWILNIRKGVHFAFDPSNEAGRLAAGREMTADDVVYSLNYIMKDPRGYTYTAQPAFAKAAIIEKTGPWQVTLKTPELPSLGFQWATHGGGVQWVWPKDVQEKYGQLNSWKHLVGTGPFMMTDFVSGSSATFTRNPNYWQKNPVGPGKGDQLPYLDGIELLIVPDISTRFAAIRTGKADWIDDVLWEDARSLQSTNRDLQSYKFVPATMVVGMRTDKENLPYKDKRVRQALMLATDFDTFAKGLYQGQADIFTFPVAPVKGTENIYYPIEKMPEAAKSLYTYNPTKAKQLLTEAGYPNGFKASIVVQASTSSVDTVSILKNMWAKVGIELEIQPKESGVFTSIGAARSHEDMIFRNLLNLTAFNQRYVFSSLRYQGQFNPSYVNEPFGKDPVIEKAFQDIQNNIMVNYAKADQIIHDLTPYLVEQAYYIAPPMPYSYRLWQPWVKNYYGEVPAKYYIPYLWLDQDLKAKMAGSR